MVTENLLLGLAAIVICGIGAYWIAWRLHLPSILLLLIVGFIVGPVTNFLDPDLIFNHLLFPIISFSVAVILFEGGLNLHLVELREAGRVIRNLVTLGVLGTWLLITAAAFFIFKIGFPLATLLGAILVVTGPTVIIPLLRHIRPTGPVGPIIKWEGMVNDPIGAILAVLVFEAILSVGFHEATTLAITGVVKTLFVSIIIGLLSAQLLLLLLRRHWIPDFLQNPLSLMMVIGAFTLSDLFQSESGLLTVTLMGLMLANQKKVSVKHIIEFKESLRVLLISSLFIILAARMSMENLEFLNFQSFLFVGVIVLVIRPLVVFLCTLKTKLHWKEKLFLAWMAPRGIVAAAVASLFSIELINVGYPGAEYLVPITFLVIISTVAIYGLTSSPLARLLGLATPNPQGTLLIGAHVWSRALAKVLKEEGYPVLLVDTNRENIASARRTNLSAFYASILSPSILDEIQMDGIGRLLALTSNDEVNALATLHFVDMFGRAEVYQMLPHGEGKGSEKQETMPKHLRGRFLFGPKATFYFIDAAFREGSTIRKIVIPQDMDYETFQKNFGETTTLLFHIRETGELGVLTADNVRPLKKNQVYIALVEPKGV